jgi:hypothetical protein
VPLSPNSTATIRGVGSAPKSSVFFSNSINQRFLDFVRNDKLQGRRIASLFPATGAVALQRLRVHHPT